VTLNGRHGKSVEFEKTKTGYKSVQPVEQKQKQKQKLRHPPQAARVRFSSLTRIKSQHKIECNAVSCFGKGRSAIGISSGVGDG